jgi:hypothetical protein
LPAHPWTRITVGASPSVRPWLSYAISTPSRLRAMRAAWQTPFRRAPECERGCPRPSLTTRNPVGGEARVRGGAHCGGHPTAQELARVRGDALDSVAVASAAGQTVPQHLQPAQATGGNPGRRLHGHGGQRSGSPPGARADRAAIATARASKCVPAPSNEARSVGPNAPGHKCSQEVLDGSRKLCPLLVSVRAGR